MWQIQASLLCLRLQQRRPRRLTGTGDGPHRASGVGKRGRTDVVGIGKRRLLAGQGAHANPLIDVEAARFDDPLVQAPGFRTRVLKIQVGIIDPMAEDIAKGARQIALTQAKRCQ